MSEIKVKININQAVIAKPMIFLFIECWISHLFKIYFWIIFPLSSPPGNIIKHKFVCGGNWTVVEMLENKNHARTHARTRTRTHTHTHTHIFLISLPVTYLWELFHKTRNTFTFYIYAFSRRFYPKRLTLHSSYSFYIFISSCFPWESNPWSWRC